MLDQNPYQSAKRKSFKFRRF